MKKPIILVVGVALAAVAAADATVYVRKAEGRGIWEGWGASLAWWANGVGQTPYASTYADLMFTRKTVPLLGKSVPGLGLNIARYNVGGGGMGDVIDGWSENVPAGFPWYKDIDGFWINWFSKNPASGSWDWNRDANQRSILKAASERGARIEFFANAPMWWMTHEKSSAGGILQAWNRRDFATYLATVVKRATTDWGVKVESVEPFNEPNAWWWKYPAGQECCPIAREIQAEILGYLREELNVRSLGRVTIAASDENTMSEATDTYNAFKTLVVPVNGVQRSAASLVGRVNVHSYYGLQPWRDNEGRKALRTAIGTKQLWVTEFGDPDGGGMTLAQTIMEDVRFLRPTGWCYWQPIEPYSGWGLINADYAEQEDKESETRGAPTWLYTKYYTFAQFTRFIRPGYRLLGNNNDNAITAYDAVGRRLVMVFLNFAVPQKVTLDLGGLTEVGTTASLTVTNTGGPKILKRTSLTPIGKRVSFTADANSVHSIVVDGVTL